RAGGHGAHSEEARMQGKGEIVLQVEIGYVCVSKMGAEAQKSACRKARASTRRLLPKVGLVIHQRVLPSDDAGPPGGDGTMGYIFISEEAEFRGVGAADVSHVLLDCLDR